MLIKATTQKHAPKSALPKPADAFQPVVYLQGDNLIVRFYDEFEVLYEFTIKATKAKDEMYMPTFHNQGYRRIKGAPQNSKWIR